MDKSNIIIIILLLLVISITSKKSLAQGNDCILKEPLLTIDFGAGKMEPGIELPDLPAYGRQYTTCPMDGHYSFASHTADCFNGDWFTMDEDHTPNDEDGNMMLVNASETGGVFFSTTLNNLSANTTYQLAVWMLNVCRMKGGCAPLPPNIHILVKTLSGQILGDYRTGLLNQMYEPHWSKYAGFFITPANVSSLQLIMEDNTLGGCGNDFAMDDITIRECAKPLPVSASPAVSTPKAVATRSPVMRPGERKLPQKPRAVKNNIPVINNQEGKEEKPVIVPPERPAITAAPEPILTRANPIVKQLETVAGDIQIDLYDNGEIDGDTVSIYHNNELIVSRAGLSDKPVTFRVKVNPAHPHHELVMVANNLGSIPPNTSLMVITVNNKRSEVFISSSEQKNAKIVIDLKN